jgi:uncharacterized membrane protein YfhO
MPREPYLSVNYGSHAAPARPLPHPVRRPAAGQVIAQNVNLSNGAAEATVRMRRPGVVVLSASFDPGWTVSVNGHRRATRMIAPALVGAEVPAGTDRVVFRYHGDRWYPELFLLSGLALLITGLGAPAIRRARRQRTRSR